MSKGWFNQGWRHAMAARGVSTRYAFSRKPLITNHEIKMIENSTNRRVGDMADHEIAGYVKQIRSPAMNVRQQDKPKVDYFEPFRSPEEKSDIGKQMVEQKIAKTVADADKHMTDRNIDFEAKKRIMDHYVNPLAEKFRKGNISERDFDMEVDSKVKANTEMNRTDGLGAFSWAEEKPVFGWAHQQPKKEPEPEIGALNFIDKAKSEM